MNESLARDLYYFFAAILKAGVMTGILPALVCGALYEVCYGPKLGKVIPFPRKPQGPGGVARKVA